ncbi:MAG: amino acid ABC transporter permease [Parolsenella sp.]|uniref:amino acid ABC transporter permease n=1 Tax=Parolsenella sp. TaxID=2083006 RepID=UPI002A7532ED|nr:amino acid ABC transporter permease [Parolsenella sp.]MCI5950294.1 amino acid ABC transporter permease [Coriobacteriaceae bacterium]MDY3292268.1 amino acid ABC transporter permease [Parolsenella sp.]
MIDWAFIAEAFPQVLASIPMTLLLVFVSIPIGWVLGILIALIKNAKVPVLYQVSVVFVSFMRSVPMVVVLFVAYYSVPLIIQSYTTSIGLSVNVDAVPAAAYAICAFIFEQAAYSSEVFRSAILAVDKGQLEAAESVGMTKTVAYLRIVLPQAITSALPNLNGLFVGLVQGTSLAYFVGVYEVMATSNLLATSSYAYIEAYLMATVIYEVLSFVFNRIFRVIEGRASRYLNLTAPDASAQTA